MDIRKKNMKKIYAIFILFFVLCACATGQKRTKLLSVVTTKYGLSM